MPRLSKEYFSNSRILLIFLTFSLPGTVAAEEIHVNPFELRDLAIAGDFEALDRRIVGAWSRYDAGEIRERTADSHLRAFAATDPALAAPLDQWVDVMPNSWAALAARGLYRYHAGTSYRGEALARDTSPDRFRLMRQLYADARSDFEAALAHRARLGPVHSALIHMAKAEGNRERLDEIYRKAVSAAPFSFVVRAAYLSSLQPQWGGSKEAMRRFVDESLQLSDENPEFEYLEIQLRENLARAHSHRGDHRETVRVYSEILADKETAALYMIRGEAYLRMRRLEEALADFGRASELLPYWAPPLNGSAWIKARLNRNDEALEDLNLALRIEPLEPKYLRARASELNRQYRFEEAVADLTKALVFGWDDPRNWFRRGELYAEALRDDKHAVPDFRKATELSPRDPKNWWYLGKSLSKLGKCEAIDTWRTYKSLCDTSPRCGEQNYPIMQRLTDELISKQGCTLPKG